MENANVKYLVGDVFDRMAELEDGSIDLILTSPPFLALRSYLPSDHPDKDKEIGSESTPAEYIDVLLRLTAEWRRLLAPHGSLVVELGDTFSGSSMSGGDDNLSERYPTGRSGAKPRHPAFRQVASREHRPERDGTGADGGPRLVPMNSGNGWPLAKSLTLIPESYRFALAYGLNPHTGQSSPAGTWRIRNVIRWVRPNPPVGALGDKFRPATSELVAACVSKDRYFDLDAVREPSVNPIGVGVRPTMARVSGKDDHDNRDQLGPFTTDMQEAGAPPLDWWQISPKGYAGAHYAVWPSELCVKPIKAMCPKEVCRECGEPRRRIDKDRTVFEHNQPRVAKYIRDARQAKGLSRTTVNDWFGGVALVEHWETTDQNNQRLPTPEDWLVLKDRLDLDARFDSLILGDRQWTKSTVEYVDYDGQPIGRDRSGGGLAYGRGGGGSDGSLIPGRRIPPDGWSDCGHDNYRPGLVLDPFAGTGTTLAVAHGHGRDAIGIDLDPRSAELARERVGPLFLEVVASA